MITAWQSLIIDELVMTRALGSEKWDKNIILISDTLKESKDDFKFCEPLVYLDSKIKTINLVHQSVKDYLLCEDF